MVPLLQPAAVASWFSLCHGLTAPSLSATHTMCDLYLIPLSPCHSVCVCSRTCVRARVCVFCTRVFLPAHLLLPYLTFFFTRFLCLFSPSLALPLHHYCPSYLYSLLLYLSLSLYCTSLSLSLSHTPFPISVTISFSFTLYSISSDASVIQCFLGERWYGTRFERCPLTSLKLQE